MLSVFLLIRPSKKNEDNNTKQNRHIIRNLADKEGISYIYSYNPITGILLSIAVGYLSSLLGIGGGIIHVPALVHLLNFPVHIATATSHFILAVMALSGSVVHIAEGTLQSGIFIVTGLSVGVLLGAQIGAKFSTRIKGNFIIKSLAVALGLVGIRIFLMTFF